MVGVPGNPSYWVLFFAVSVVAEAREQGFTTESTFRRSILHVSSFSSSLNHSD